MMMMMIMMVMMMMMMMIIIIIIIIIIALTVSKPSRKYLSNIPRKHEIRELQKTAILCTAHILQHVLTYKYKTFIINTLHKGDK